MDSLAGRRPLRVEVVHRIPPPRGVVILALMYAVIGVAGLAGVAFVAGPEVTILWLACGGVAAFVIPVSAFLLRLALVPAVVTTTVVATPRAIRGWTVVPLDLIAGVGLRYQSTGNARSSGWVLGVWMESGQSIGIKVAPPRHSAPPGQRRVLHCLTHYVPPLDWDYLAASPGGRAATAIQDAVLAIQGPAGLLAIQRRERVPDATGRHTAYWSPAGGVAPLSSPPNEC